MEKDNKETKEPISINTGTAGCLPIIILCVYQLFIAPVWFSKYYDILTILTIIVVIIWFITSFRHN